jgi:hypothetical protein
MRETAAIPPVVEALPGAANGNWFQAATGAVTPPRPASAATLRRMGRSRVCRVPAKRKFAGALAYRNADITLANFIETISSSAGRCKAIAGLPIRATLVRRLDSWFLFRGEEPVL